MFIPGLASAGAVWDAAATSIVDGHDLHIVTLAGFAGLPAVDPTGPFIGRAVGGLADYLDEEGLQDVVLMECSVSPQRSTPCGTYPGSPTGSAGRSRTVLVPMSLRGAIEHSSAPGDPGFANEYTTFFPIFNINRHIHHHEDPTVPWYLLE